MEETGQGYGACLKVDINSLCRNFTFLKQRAANAECAAVLKANAYGVGIEPVARALAPHTQSVFVAYAEEGQALRSILPHHRIFVLHGFAPHGADLMRRFNLIPVINTLEQLQEWRFFCRQRGEEYPAALQVDSGMSRFGLSKHDLHDENLEGFKPVLVMSHLACADDPQHPANKEQRDCFVEMASHFPGVPRSLAASSGIFLGPDYHFEMVRPGAGLYGIAPNEKGNPLEPVIRLEARVLQIRHIEQNDGVGYGMTWHAQRATRLATVGIGYADGFSRSLSGNLSLWYHDKALPIVGRVSMDSVSVDIGKLPEGALQVGDCLSVIGPHQTVDDLARAAGTIGYEILTSLGQRFKRIYTYSDMTEK